METLEDKERRWTAARGILMMIRRENKSRDKVTGLYVVGCQLDNNIWFMKYGY